jgi:hypothetical protein
MKEYTTGKACIMRERNAYNILVWKRDGLEDIGVNGRAVLNQTLEE